MSEVSSPPYPPRSLPAAMIHAKLHEMRLWANGLRELLIQTAIDRNIEGADALDRDMQKPREPGPVGAYQGFAVVCHYEDLMAMRKLREAWDSLLREYEDVWMCDACFRAAAMLYGQACAHLTRATMNFEQREADAASRGQAVLAGVLGPAASGLLPPK